MLGSVRVLGDRSLEGLKMRCFEPRVTLLWDFCAENPYPAGNAMAGKRLLAGLNGSSPSHYVAAHGSRGEYRYRYNGMEHDPEVKGNSYTTEFRQYDPRLGRWLSLDPLMQMFPSMSPYCAFDNNPIYYTDPLGVASEGEPEKKGDTFIGDDGKEYRITHDEVEASGKEQKEKTEQLKVMLKGNTNKMRDLYGMNYPQKIDRIAPREYNPPKPTIAKDDDKIDFFVLGAGAGGSAGTYGASGEIKNIWVFQDGDNIHVQNSGRWYLTYGLNYGKEASESLADVSAGAQAGYGYMTNVHPYDDLGELFENATDVEVSFGSGDLSGGFVVSKSKGKNGIVYIYLFFGEYGQRLGTRSSMPVKNPLGVKGGVYGKELERTVSKKVNAADTGRAILNNPSNNLPPMSNDQIKRMDKILMGK